MQQAAPASSIVGCSRVIDTYADVRFGILEVIKQDLEEKEGGGIQRAATCLRADSAIPVDSR